MHMYICLHAYKYIYGVIMCGCVNAVFSWSWWVCFLFITGDLKDCCAYVNRSYCAISVLKCLLKKFFYFAFAFIMLFLDFLISFLSPTSILFGPLTMKYFHPRHTEESMDSGASVSECVAFSSNPPTWYPAGHWLTVTRMLRSNKCCRQPVRNQKKCDNQTEYVDKALELALCLDKLCATNTQEKGYQAEWL